MRGPCRVQVRLPGWAPSVTATEEAASDTEARGLARRARSIPDLSSACWAGAGRVRTERASGVQASRRASDRCTWQGAGRGRRFRFPCGKTSSLTPQSGMVLFLFQGKSKPAPEVSYVQDPKNRVLWYPREPPSPHRARVVACRSQMQRKQNTPGASASPASH